MEKSQTDFSWPELVLTNDFFAHQELLELVDGSLRDTLRGMAKRLKDLAREAGEEDAYQELMSIGHGYELESEGGQFTAIMFGSLFVASYALFEHSLLAICDRAREHACCPIPVGMLGSRDMTGNSKKYLNALGIEFPPGAGEWGEINRYKEIRNKIVHGGSAVSKGTELYRYVEKKRILSAGGAKASRFLEITRPFCEEAIENERQFIILTFRAYDQWRRGPG